jgi:hypothetical protein
MLPFAEDSSTRELSLLHAAPRLVKRRPALWERQMAVKECLSVLVLIGNLTLDPVATKAPKRSFRPTSSVRSPKHERFRRRRS